MFPRILEVGKLKSRQFLMSLPNDERSDGADDVASVEDVVIGELIGKESSTADDDHDW